MRRGYTFDDVALVPQFNNVPSRTEPSLETWLTKTLKMKIPLVCANMDTTISEELADVLLEAGSIPIFHRFTTMEQQEIWVKKYGQKMFISCGIKVDKSMDRIVNFMHLHVPQVLAYSQACSYLSLQ